MNRPTYGTAVFRPMSGTMPIAGPRAIVLQFDEPIAGMPVRVLEPQLEGLFDDIGHAISHAVSDVGHAVSDAGRTISHVASDVGHAVDHAVHDVGKAVSDTTKWIGHAIQHPDQAISEAANWIVHAAKDVGNFIGHNIVAIVQLVQIGVSFIPGIGEGLSAAIGVGLALAEGKSITDALIAGALSALPGGPIVSMAASIAAEAITGAIEHKSFADIAGNIIADNIPAGGALAKAVVHAAAGVIGAATTGHSVGDALVTGVTSAAGAALGGQIPIPSGIANLVDGAAGKVVGAATNVLGKTVVDAAGHVISDVAHGKRLDQAVAGAASGAVLDAAGSAIGVHLPSGQLADTAKAAASGLLQGKPLDMVALNAARANLPGGQDARNAFDMAIALHHAKNVQQAGIAHPESLLPNDPQSQKFFHATRVIVGVGLNAAPGLSFDALHRLQLKALQDHIARGAPAVPRPTLPGSARGPAAAPPAHPYGRRAPQVAQRMAARPAGAQAPAHPYTNGSSSSSSLVVPLAIGGAALAAAGGAVWWVHMNHEHQAGGRKAAKR